jgi:hypothetical protein
MKIAYERLYAPVNEGPSYRPATPPPQPKREEIAVIAIPGVGLITLEAFQQIGATDGNGQIIDHRALEREGPPNCPYCVQIGPYIITPEHYARIKHRP